MEEIFGVDHFHIHHDSFGESMLWFESWDGAMFQNTLEIPILLWKWIMVQEELERQSGSISEMACKNDTKMNHKISSIGFLSGFEISEGRSKWPRYVRGL